MENTIPIIVLLFFYIGTPLAAFLNFCLSLLIYCTKNKEEKAEIKPHEVATSEGNAEVNEVT